MRDSVIVTRKVILDRDRTASNAAMRGALNAVDDLAWSGRQTESVLVTVTLVETRS